MRRFKQTLRLKPGQMDLTEVFNFLPPIGPANHGTDGKKEHIVEGIMDFFALALVMNVSKKLSKKRHQ